MANKTHRVPYSAVQWPVSWDPNYLTDNYNQNIMRMEDHIVNMFPIGSKITLMRSQGVNEASVAIGVGEIIDVITDTSGDWHIVVDYGDADEAGFIPVDEVLEKDDGTFVRFV